ncbi:uncharacterized protein LOC133737384 [Rosa rugosa]|uniref:uncharacterized protein LOC133737384 n=1 Tax=Rosa rugosa TaxID=74645 RepID=UPI002B407508|nr:uncharacterized protein LOC133737384 [Rosa rugosa]
MRDGDAINQEFVPFAFVVVYFEKHVNLDIEASIDQPCSWDSQGLAFLWRQGIPVRIRNYFNNHIDVEIGEKGSQDEFCFTGIYGFASNADRVRTWDLLCTLASQSTLPWQALVDCALIDMKFVGSRFTWANRFTKERLDRACHTVEWRDKFPHSRVVTLPLSRSDHNPLLVEVNSTAVLNHRAPKHFRFEEMWSQHKDCPNLIQQGWMMPSTGDPMLQVGRKIRNTGKLLMKWHVGVFQQRHTEMRVVQNKLEQLMSKPYDPEQFEEQKALQFWLNELLSLNETYWRQRSRVQWLKEAAVLTTHYEHIFKSEGYDPLASNLILEAVQPRVTSQMNADLVAPYMDDEIKVALFQMHPSKSPGPDGMSPHFFFQKYWSIVHVDVCLAVRTVLETGQLPHESNFTHLVLIPKVKDPKTASDLRPIALCNVVYKITSKVLANRLKVILPQIISPLQSAFVPGRLISDNSSVATEITHFMKKLRTQAEGFFSLKLDISKAYDRLEWTFLEAILVRLGFCSKWVEVILSSLKSVSYSLIINGEPTSFITPTRGIRQGDPLSPYLFILCAEGFSSFITASVSQGILKGLLMNPSAPVIHHLLFSDDSLMFGEASEHECLSVKAILDIYGRASGQQINLQKSSVVFSSNVGMDSQHFLASILGVQRVSDHGQYLGLPLHVGRSKVAVFAYLKERLTKKLVSWRAKTLSIGGKETLIKAVAQSVPQYVMNCYLLPKSLCDDLQQLCAQFFWGSTDDQKKIIGALGSECACLNRRVNVAALHACFPPEVVTQVMCIPLSRRRALDTITWKPDKKGFFSVKSAYKVARDFTLSHIMSSSSGGDPYAPLWKALWKARVPGKVAIFGWRASHNLLPTRACLSLKGYMGDLHCLHCQFPWEDLGHILCQCPIAHNIWGAHPFNLVLDVSSHLDFKNWLLERATSLSSDLFDKMLVLLWSLWKNRNDKLWNEKHKDGPILVATAMGWYEEYLQANVPSGLVPSTPMRPVAKSWCSPRPETVKLNIDGSYLPNVTYGGVGGVLRNDQAAFLAAFSIRESFVTSPLHVELLAIKHGLLLLLGLGVNSAIIETDCLVAVHAISSPFEDLSGLSNLIVDIKDILQTWPLFIFVHVSRQANRVAHRLANISFDSDIKTEYWFNHAPDFLSDALLYDLNRV